MAGSQAAPSEVSSTAVGEPTITAQKSEELTGAMRPQGPHATAPRLRFETGEHGGDYPDAMPQAVTVTDA